MKNIFKKFFTLSNWKRIAITSVTLIGTIIAIFFGSAFYISNNPNKSIEYGGGIEVLVQVKDKNGQNADKNLTEQVSNSLSDRLTGGTGLTGTKVSSEGDGKIRITQSGELNDSQRRAFESKITDKTITTITDIDVNPLFFNGKFTKDGSLSVGNENNWIPPFAEDGAIATQQESQNVVQITLKNDDAVLQWTEATKYVSELKDQGKNVILIWSNIQEALAIAKEEFPKDWEESGQNLYNFMYINNQPTTITFDEKTNTPRVIRNQLKKNVFDASKYLISVASVETPLNTSRIIISGGGNSPFTVQSARELADGINFGLTDYSLEVLSSVYVDKTLQNSAFESAILAGIVVFSLIAIFMIVNYGLLGALSTISIALYVFLTLLVFTAIRGEYSPSTIAALIIGIGISVDANIITFERLKREIYNGDGVTKAFKNSNSLSLSSIVDANLTTMIVAFTLFYFGTKSVKGFSISLILSIIFTLIVMLIFTRFLSTMLVGTGMFNNKLWLLGVHKKYIKQDQSKKLIYRFDYNKNAKWFALGSFIFIIVGAIVFVAVGLSNGNIYDGVERAIEFKGGLNLIIQGNVQEHFILNEEDANNIKDYIFKNADKWGLLNVDKILSVQKNESSSNAYSIIIRTSQDLSDKITSIQSDLLSQFPSLSFINYTVSTKEARDLLLNAMFAVGASFIGIVLYTLLRMRWTFSIAAILGLIHDLLMVVAFVIITRLEVSSIIVAAMLSIVGFSINDTIVTFDRIKEIIHLEYSSKTILSKEDINKIANKAIAQTMKRSIYTTLTTMFAVIILLFFKNATDFVFNVTILFGIAIGTYSSVFICSWFWTKLEYFRQKRIEKRIRTRYWNINNPEEQTFKGINDYSY
ncbi:protein translocase subunit SecDF [Mycoplasmopsis ciconiae]|uniref:Protein translocase subunit SecDF n=1 Tax=Mycoplasmopsis ciconiae TaxID=561067 RepID=A0ABU7MLT8_9BACT|nr:protein translocase subunit SecDF [Mycoplasmopsis ciconiae]